MVEALDVNAIQKVWNDYFVLIGVEQVKRGDETKAVVEATSQQSLAATDLEKAVATAQRAFDLSKKKAEDKHAKRSEEIAAALQAVRDIANKASQSTKDHQDKAEEELGVRPSIPQGTPQTMRRVSL